MLFSVCRLFSRLQVSPSELESILLAHHEVADAVVFALHDKVSGDDLPAAWVVREEGGRVTEEELYLHVSGRDSYD